MRYICDFHIHSKYSRATSRDMNIESLEKWAKIKGISVLGTGDFTHPLWLKELKAKLEPAEEGLYKLSNQQNNVRFILTSEISCIYLKHGKVRKIHLIIFAPSFKVVERINTQLSWSGNLSSDGRPILGMDVKEVLKIMLNSSPECLMVPAHVWTPWYSLFGSRSGFDSLRECFEELSSYIFALETGLSSDPAMNWRLSALDKYTLISNSDAHSPAKIGREANVFEGENLTYNSIIKAIKPKKDSSLDSKSKFGDRLSFVFTIEFFPEEGKYHYDGHRLCRVRLSPAERKKYGGICPNCGRPVTVGVLSRVDTLADREEGFTPTKARPFNKIVPLVEIIAEIFSQTTPTSKIVNEEYQRLINYFGNEFEILLNVPIEEIIKISPKVGEGVKKIRRGEIKIIPGYDGEYGKVQIFNREEEKKINQKTLF